MSPALLLTLGGVSLAGYLPLAHWLRGREDGSKHLHALAFALMLAAVCLPFAALYRIRETLSLTEQIAAAIVAVAVLEAIGRLSGTPGTVPDDGISRLWRLAIGVYLAWAAFDLLHFGDTAGGHPLVLPLLAALSVATSIRALVIHWHDEDALDEAFGDSAGYVQHRSAVAPRTRAVAVTALMTLVLLGLVTFSIWDRFA